MDAALSLETLDGLFPFSFLVDEKGEVLWAGRSIRKIVGGGDVCGVWHHCFNLERPEERASRPDDLNALVGQFIVLRVRAESGPAVRFRGQVARLAGTPARWLFLLGPSISDIKEVRASGLTYTDFSPGDMIFDFLMLLQSERRSFHKSELARQGLVWRNRISDLLYRCALLSADGKDGGLHLVVDLVSRELGFDFGHVFLVRGDQLVSSGEAFCGESFKQTPQVHGFLAATLHAVFRRGEGVPGRVWESGRLIWGERLRNDAEFPRGSSIGADISWSGIAVPVRVGGEMVAVLEFYSLRALEELLGEKQNLVRFLETLSLQLGALIERQRYVERERSQQATILASANLSSLGEMAAGVAHEINNPLTAILLGSTQARQISQRAPTDLATLSKVLERIERSADRIGKIVSGMRTLSRDGSGDPFVSSDLNVIIEDTLSVCLARFRNAGVELHSSGRASAGVWVRCRPVQVSQVLLNLLNNAFDAVSGQEGAWVRLETRTAPAASDSTPDWVEVAVSNSGPKISPELAPQIMRPFFTTKPVGKGTGLGLSIARSIADAHAGALTIELEREHTTFVLRLPAAARTTS